MSIWSTIRAMKKTKPASAPTTPKPTGQPEEVLDAAVATPGGVTLHFTDPEARNSFKTRVSKKRHAICYANAEPHPWDDLVVRAPSPTTLWIGPPSLEAFGITAITEGKDK